MPIEKVKIEFTEEDLKKVLTEHYGLEPGTTLLRIYHHEGDRPWEPSYATVTLEGIKK